MFNSFHQVQLQKNLKSKLREKFKSTDIAIGPQNDPFTPFQIKEEFLSKKKCPPLFSVYWILTPSKKSEKSNETILSNRRYRQKDGRTDRYELIGPFGRVVGPNHLTFSWNIGDQRILQSDGTRGKTD